MEESRLQQVRVLSCLYNKKQQQCLLYNDLVYGGREVKRRKKKKENYERLRDKSNRNDNFYRPISSIIFNHVGFHE